jgi:hypothetical protein
MSHFAECHGFVDILGAVMLNVIGLSVIFTIMLSAILLSVIFRYYAVWRYA